MNERQIHGTQVLEEVLGEAGAASIAALRNIAPELARLYVEVPYADIYSREVLNFKTRELVAIAALTCLGDCRSQLEAHVAGAINVGCTAEEINEVILQMVAFAGFPRAINSAVIANNVISQKKP